MGSGIFVNYRVGDLENEAALLADALRVRFGRERVFHASASLAVGSDFRTGLLDGVRRCSVLLALIGPGWLDAADRTGRRRLDDPGDWVRREIAEALDAGLVVVPLLMGDRDRVPVPGRDRLPPDIADLSVRHYLRMHYQSVEVGRVVAAVLAADPLLGLVDLLVEPVRRPETWSPSALLRPDHDIVPFTGRAEEIGLIREWLEHPAPLAARVVTGPGGQGKTRLARRVLAEVAGKARGTGRSGFQTAREEGITPGTSSTDASGLDVVGSGSAGGLEVAPCGEVMLAAGADWVVGVVSETASGEAVARLALTTAPLLLVVDYAEGRTSQVTLLVEALVARTGPVRARLLLLSRSAGEWRDRLGEHADDRVAALFSAMTEQRLGPLAPAPADRRSEFLRALGAFGEHLGLPVRGVPVPPSVDDPDHREHELGLGSALDLHAAALAALLDASDPVREEPGLTPLGRVLAHEKRYWARTLGQHGLEVVDRARPAALTAFATLFTAPDRESAVTELSGTSAFEGDPKSLLRRYVRWASELYPGPEHLNPVLPDLLGEEHVAVVLQGEPELAVPPAGMGDRRLSRALTVLGRLLPAHPGAEQALRLALTADPLRVLPSAVLVAPELAEPGPFTTVLRDVLDGHHDPALLRRVLDALPHASEALASVAVLTTELSLATAREHAALEPLRTANLLVRHSWNQRRTGDPELAVESARAAVAVLGGGTGPAGREQSGGSLGDLAPALRPGAPMPTPERRLPVLATALVAAADHLGLLGRYQEGEALVAEAVAHWRELVGSAPGEHEDELASALHTRADYLSEAGLFAEALQAAREAAALRRGKGSSRADLASALMALSHCLGQVGALQERLEVAEEAVRLSQGLADENPDAYARSCGRALGQYAEALRATGKRVEAVRTSARALAVRQEIAARYPEVYRAEVAGALAVHGSALSEVGEHVRALDALTEAAGVYRALEGRSPGAHRMELLATETNLAGELSQVGRNEEALEAVEPVLAACRDLAARERAAHLPDLGNALLMEARVTHRAGRYADAEQAALEALSLYRELSAELPDAYRHLAARAANTRGVALSALGRQGEALEVLNGVLVERVALAGRHRDAYQGELASAYHNTSTVPDELGQAEAGLAAGSQAFRELRELAARSPGHTRQMASVASTLGVRMAENDRAEAGALLTRLAVEALRPVEAEAPEVVGPDLAMALDNLGLVLSALGRDAEALEVLSDAVSRYRVLVAGDPDVHLSGLAHALHNRSIRLGDLGRPDEAVEGAQEAVALFRELAGRHPGTPSIRLARALVNLTGQLGDAGLDATGTAREAVELFEAVPGGVERFAREIRVLRDLLAEGA
ncbi:tetratricopeptide repeat protein [Actinosynnema pretiosum]|uniref:tetratricopeptide repeat protein n=1 Tax=Actinosynnema pretiosum TaxID=42197 RepID=UPI0015A713FB|nr:tetratricopeptide repeat protein [Actinosynnema pretiosum]